MQWRSRLPCIKTTLTIALRFGAHNRCHGNCAARNVTFDNDLLTCEFVELGGTDILLGCGRVDDRPLYRPVAIVAVQRLPLAPLFRNLLPRL